MRIKIARIGTEKPIVFATEELVRYLKKIDLSTDFDILVCNNTKELPDDAIVIGTGIGIKESQDDSIKIDVNNAKGVITASNPRSVLIAVYKFLTAFGCAFISPEREKIPQFCLKPEVLSVSLFETASYRHRGICIEGSVSYSHVLAAIDWLPKAAMNCYFFQFRVPYTFFDRYYSKNGIKCDQNDVKGMYLCYIEEMQKRGVVYHAVGHSWTCEPFGISGSGWYVDNNEIAPEIRECLAEIDGKRELFGGVALNTNLCYSNPYVRKTIANAVMEYCLEHPEIDCLHFWLADEKNNHCECENCRDTLPSDFYVQMLNEIDALLTEKNIKVKIVFIVYLELLWAPEHTVFNNPDRFLLLFAPITRVYSETYQSTLNDPEPELAPFVRNKLNMPASVKVNVARLKKWQEKINCDSLVFDYHLMWDHMNDPGYMISAKTLFSDMVNLDKIGLNGMLSCQLQRVGFPTWMPMFAMSRALWNKNITFESVCDEYYTAEFGSDGKKVCEYLTKLSELFDPPYIRGHKPTVSPESAERYASIPQYIQKFVSEIAGKEGAEWDKLRIHAELVSLLSEGLCAKAKGDTQAQEEYRLRLIDLATKDEKLADKSFDSMFFVRMVNLTLKQ